ncbi:DNA polymerase III subunit delta' [Streptococcus sp. zg-JUN1979]|uniref:DNA polymerase III subunit delta' n=1 Tax=Streptococcus sp. zg-JUN1979 TaxID=3391450 RepID=UPI0039A46992
MTRTLSQLQPALLASFKRILQEGKLSHAYLFSGGFGSFEMAIYLAQSRFCQQLQDNLPCGECRSCRLISQGEFTDVKVVEPTGQTIKTETIRQLLGDFYRSGFEGARQVFIIKDCEKMHPNAANSLLKAIEEPQIEAYILLLTSDESKVLTTIKSRTQIFHFPKNTAYLIELAEKEGLLKSQATLVANLADSPSELLSLCQDRLTFSLIQACQDLVTYLFNDKGLAYLQVARLVSLASDKKEEEKSFGFLTLLLSQEMTNPKARDLLAKVAVSKEMWQRHVHFQNALEYMVLS